MPTRGPAYSKIDATREAAARAGCTLLFKGPDTVIAGNFGGTVDPRICDFAARALSRRWPDRYAFDFGASFEDRTARIAALRASPTGRR